MSEGELKLSLSVDTSEAEASLDRVKEKLKAVTAAAREAMEAVSQIGKSAGQVTTDG